VSSDDNLDRSRSLAVYIQAISDDTLDRLRSVAVYIQALSDDIQDLLRSAACYEFYLPVDGAQGGLLLLRHSALALA
jgi:hypothetical protein